MIGTLPTFPFLVRTRTPCLGHSGLLSVPGISHELSQHRTFFEKQIVFLPEMCPHIFIWLIPAHPLDPS